MAVRRSVVEAGLRAVYALALWGLCAAAAPQEEDLWAQATLYRDEWGVPHVYARTPRGLGFAFGYAQAEDHAEPMLLAYRAVTGRLAEVKGEEAAASDAFALRMGHGQLAERALAELDDVTRELCEGFALGVNAWLASNIDKVPEWAEGVSPYEVLALWHAFLTGQAPLDLPGVTAPPRAMESANAWAVHGKHTPEGQAVLVVNPHQFHAGPFLWTEAHLVLDDYDVYGATLYGLPIIVMGHNPALGWALSPCDADTADVFERPTEQGAAPSRPANSLSLPDEAGNQALLLEYYSKARPYYVNVNGRLEERLAPVHITPAGPILEHNGVVYLWRIARYGEFGGIRQLIDMGRSYNLAQFQQSLLWQQLPPTHLVYADAMGNIFYVYNVTMGFRRMPDEAEVRLRNLTEGQLTWREPLPNAMQAWGWSDELGVADMPFVVNPDSGFVQACGASPWTASDVLPYTADLWPFYVSADYDTYRAARVRQLLRSGMRSFRDNQSMLYDLVAPAAADMKGALLQAAGQHPDWVEQSHPDVKELLQVLKNWDNLADVRSAGMTAYHLWWSALRARMGGAPDTAIQQMILSGDEAMLREAMAAAGEAARMMRNEFDRIDLPWGEAHRVQRGARVEALPGAITGEPVFTAGDFTFEEGQWRADYGYGFAMAVQFGQRPQAVSVTPFGASDMQGSPHFDDQLDLLLTRRFKRTRYQSEEVLRNASVARGREITLYPTGMEAALRFVCEAPMSAALNTLPEAPGILPQGHTAFGLFVQTMVQRPAAAEARADMSFYVPPELCAEEDLEQLGLYRYAAPEGWTRLESAQWDTFQRAIMASGPVDGIYAVLGPESVFAAAAPEGEAESTDSDRVPAPLVGATPPLPEAPSPPPPGALLPPEPEMKGDEKIFKFQWANPPKPLEGTGENTFQTPRGERQFKFERLNTGGARSPEAPLAPMEAPMPEASTEDTPSPQTEEDMPAREAEAAPAPKTRVQTDDSPDMFNKNRTGARQFKFKRGGGEVESAPGTAPGKGKVVYGLPPHVLERQQKMQQQQQQEEEQ